MLDQEVVLGKHHSFETAVTDELHCTMKQYFEVLYHLHVVYMTLHTGCPFSPLSLFGGWKGKLENPRGECTVICTVLQENSDELLLKYDLYLKFKPLKGYVSLLEIQGWENFLQSITILPKHSAGSDFFFLVIPHHPYSCEAGEQEAPTPCCLSVRLHQAVLPGYSSPRCSPHKNASSRDQKERLRIENKNKCQSKAGLNLVHLQIKLSYN